MARTASTISKCPEQRHHFEKQAFYSFKSSILNTLHIKACYP